MEPDQIGICVDVLFHKKWGKTPINGQLRSRLWWERRLQLLIERPAITIPTDLLTDWELPDKPIPYEIEMKIGEYKEDLGVSPKTTGI